MPVKINITLDENEKLHLKCDKCGLDKSFENKDEMFAELSNHVIVGQECPPRENSN
jgi:hypothetical protein